MTCKTFFTKDRSIYEGLCGLCFIMEEVFNIAIAHEINLSKEVVIETMEFIDALPEEGTASMQRDIIESRPS